MLCRVARGAESAFVLPIRAELIWLDAIYGVDLTTYGHDPGYITDIKALAKSIMDGHDPAYNRN